MPLHILEVGMPTQGRQLMVSGEIVPWRNHTQTACGQFLWRNHTLGTNSFEKSSLNKTLEKCSPTSNFVFIVTDQSNL